MNLLKLADRFLKKVSDHPGQKGYEAKEPKLAPETKLPKSEYEKKREPGATVEVDKNDAGDKKYPGQEGYKAKEPKLAPETKLPETEYKKKRKPGATVKYEK